VKISNDTPTLKLSGLLLLVLFARSFVASFRSFLSQLLHVFCCTTAIKQLHLAATTCLLHKLRLACIQKRIYSVQIVMANWTAEVTTGKGDLPMVSLKSPDGSFQSSIYLHGATVTSWEHEQVERLFVSVQHNYVHIFAPIVMSITLQQPLYHVLAS
jgi:hypothetical protein